MKLKDCQVRLAKIADARAIAEMSRDFIEHGLPWNWRPPKVARSIRHADTNCVVSTLAGELVAFAITDFDQHEAHLNLLAVKPAAQRLGLGKHLVQWQEKVAETAGIRVVSLEVRADNKAAIQFYSHLGYRQIGLLRNYYCNQHDALRMVHHL